LGGPWGSLGFFGVRPGHGSKFEGDGEIWALSM
jgi:hypothetical protein